MSSVREDATAAALWLGHARLEGPSQERGAATRITLDVFWQRAGDGGRRRLREYWNTLCLYVSLLNDTSHQPRSHVHVWLVLRDRPRARARARASTPTRTPSSVVLGPEHVNGGVTFVQEQLVMVHRREDWQRVLLHELLHLYQFDFLLSEEDAARERRWAHEVFRVHPRSPYGLECVLAMNEAYNEALTAVIYMVLHVQRRLLPVSSWPAFLRAYHALRRRMTERFVRTAAWVHQQQRSEGILFERTHVFSYYVVKAALFASYDRFMQFVSNQPRIGGHRGRIDAFYRLALDCLFAPGFEKAIVETSTRRGPHSLRMLYGLPL
jgi:hypothetical protein